MGRKKVIITGGSLGIGRAIAMEFARNNWDIAVCSRKERNLIDLSKELEGQSGSNHILDVCDVSSKADLDKFWNLVERSWGSVDVLVNNAGTYLPGQIHTEESGLLEKLIDTNLMSTYHMSRNVIPLMKERGMGYIINICSTASKSAYPNGGSYSITKYAQYGLTVNLREELKEENIGVTAILPGPTLTSSWEGVDLPQSRFIDPDHIGKIALQVVQMHPRTVVEEIVLRPQLGDIA